MNLLLTLILAAGSDTVLVDARWLTAQIDRPEVVVLHAGARSDYQASHIPGARLVDVMQFHSHEGDGLPAAESMVAALELAGVSDGSRIVVYGEGLWAAVVYVALESIGLGPRTSMLDGGLAAWTAAGGAIEPGPGPTVARGDLSAGPAAGHVVEASWIAERLGRPEVDLIDARSPGEYAGTARESLPRTGHLPGARLLEWTELTDRSTGIFLAPDRLRSLFGARGVAPGDTVVAYCTVGMRASQLYVAARLAGFPARIYVGSMADWSPRTDLPISTGPNPE